MAVDAYEPWEPQVGDRVRIRISPECQFEQYSHRVIDGAAGTVIYVHDRLWRMPVYLSHTENGVNHLVEGDRLPKESEAAHRIRVRTDPATYYKSIYDSLQVLTVTVAVLEIEPLD